MDSVDSLDNMSMDILDKVQWDQPDWTTAMNSVDIVHGLSGQSVHCPWTPGQSPGRLDNVRGQSQWTDWTLSMDSLDFVKSDNLIWLKKMKLK